MARAEAPADTPLRHPLLTAESRAFEDDDRDDNCPNGNLCKYVRPEVP